MESEKEEIKKSEFINMFPICSCQNNSLKIAKSLVDIYNKIKEGYALRDDVFTGSDVLLISILDRNTNAITHGINIEYPIIYDSKLWDLAFEISKFEKD